MPKRGARSFCSDFGWKSSATWFFTVWWMFKPLTILPVAPSSVSGRAQKAGRKKGESARATMSFWNGANGWPHKSRSIAPRGLMFLLTRGPEPDWHYEAPSLILRPIDWRYKSLNYSLAESLIG